MSIVNFEKAVKVLKDGGLVVIPTETVYGLAADGLNEEAVKKIFIAKGRPLGNPLILHVSSIEMLEKVVTKVSGRARRLIESFWPGPLTLVFEKKQIVPDVVTAGLSTVCVRMPAHPLALEIINKTNSPLAAPSANRSGRPSPTRLKDVLKEMPDLPVIDGGDCQFGLESTVVDVRDEQVKILRLGSLPVENIEEVLKEKVVLIDKKGGSDVALSPGQKYPHYSPQGQVLLFNNYEEILEYLYSNSNLRNFGIICSDAEAAKYSDYNVPLLLIGKTIEEQAHNLFAVLHKTEELGWKIVFFDLEGIGDESGLGKALLERINRSAEDQP